MFEDKNFTHIPFEEIPLNRDLVLMDERWIADYEREWLKHFRGEKADLYPGYVSYVAARSVGENWLEMSWYVNISDRFHEVPVFLPKTDFIVCVDLWNYDEKPHIFVKTNWVTDLHERPLAAFAIVDGIGVKDLLRSGQLRPDALRALRDRIDAIAEQYSSFAFISFADSLLVKQAWSVGHVESKIEYTYSPEALFPVIGELQAAFKETLGISAYAVVTQGINAYADDSPVHLSKRGNHFSLNTLGLPFAQLMAIEEAARKALREGQHAPADIYLEATLFRSLRWRLDFERKKVTLHNYKSPMTKSSGSYAPISLQSIVDNLQDASSSKNKPA